MRLLQRHASASLGDVMTARVRYDDAKDFHNRVYPHQDNVLHYGQRFRLRVHPAMGLDEAVTFYLYSSK